jgi:hypothetical protein
MIKITKQDILNVDFADIIKLEETQLNIWADDNRLNRFESWLLPQLVANFGRWELCTSDNKIDILATIKHNCSDPKQQELWKLSRIKRSKLIGKQIANPKYAALTPLILAGFKQFQGIAYSSWHGLENLNYILEPELHNAVDCDLSGLDGLGSDRLLQIREQGLTQRSGVKAGQQKPAESTWSLTGIQDTEIGHLPKLTQSMLCQIWLAHPKHRDPLMILDPKNWDLIPDPLITHEVFKRPEPIHTTLQQDLPNNIDLPWLLT